MAPTLEYKNVSVSFGEAKALNNISLELFGGETLGIVGESGSGKTTLLKTAMGLLDNAAVDGKLIYRAAELDLNNEKQLQKLRGSEIGLIFQDAAASLCPVRKVGAQVLETLKAHGIADKKTAKSDCMELFRRLNFSDPERVWDSYPIELSGGMNQRVGIALAMVLNPQILLCDEPTSALDTGAARKFLAELKNVQAEFNTAIIFVTHDIGAAEAIADRVAVMKDGAIVEEGRNILRSPKNDYTKALMSAVPRLGRDCL